MISDNLRGAALMTGAMTCFTLGDALMRVVLGAMPFFQALTLRAGLLSLGLAALVMVQGAHRVPIAPADRRRMLVRGLAEFGSAVLFMAAVTQMKFATLSAILQSTPLAVTLAAALFLGLKVGWRRWLAIALGFLGVLMIVRPGTDAFTPASILAVACVAVVTVREIVTRAFSRTVPTSFGALASALTVMIGSGILSLGRPWEPVEPRIALFLLGASSLLLVAFLCAIAAMRTGEIAFVTSFRYSALLVALVLGYVVFGEVPDAMALAGAGLVVGTGLFSLYRERVTRSGAPLPRGGLR